MTVWGIFEPARREGFAKRAEIVAADDVAPDAGFATNRQLNSNSPKDHKAILRKIEE